MADGTRLKTMEIQLQGRRQFEVSTRSIEELGRNIDRRIGQLIEFGKNADRKMDQLTEMVRSLLPKDNSRSEGTPAVQQQRRVLRSGNVLGSSSSSWMREIGGASNWQSNRVRDGYDRNSIGAPKFRSARITSVGSFGEWSSEFTQDSVTVRDDATSKEDRVALGSFPSRCNSDVHGFQENVCAQRLVSFDSRMRETTTNNKIKDCAKEDIDGASSEETLFSAQMSLKVIPQPSSEILAFESESEGTSQLVVDLVKPIEITWADIKMSSHENFRIHSVPKLFEKMPEKKRVDADEIVELLNVLGDFYGSTDSCSSFVFDPGKKIEFEVQWMSVEVQSVVEMDELGYRNELLFFVFDPGITEWAYFVCCY